MCKEKLDKLTSTILTLNEIEEEWDKLPEKQSEEDSRISDLMHYIEHNKISTNGAYNLIKELKRVQTERRSTKTLMEINKTFKDNIGKLNIPANRTMLVSALNSAYKKMQGEYKNRVYTDEELAIIGRKG
jgi:hypothetical protein